MVEQGVKVQGNEACLPTLLGWPHAPASSAAAA